MPLPLGRLAASQFNSDFTSNEQLGLSTTTLEYRAQSPLLMASSSLRLPPGSSSGLPKSPRLTSASPDRMRSPQRVMILDQEAAQQRMQHQLEQQLRSSRQLPSQLGENEANGCRGNQAEVEMGHDMAMGASGNPPLSPILAAQSAVAGSRPGSQPKPRWEHCLLQLLFSSLMLSVNLNLFLLSHPFPFVNVQL